MTTPAANRPAPARTFGLLARVVRRWLGIADQQHDFDALGMTLAVKDQVGTADRTQLGRHAELLDEIAAQLNRTTNGMIGLTDRLRWHEKRVPGLAGSSKAYDLAMKREQRRRKKLIEDHPELSAAAKQHVLETGDVPEPAPKQP